MEGNLLIRTTITRWEATERIRINRPPGARHALQEGGGNTSSKEKTTRWWSI